MAGAPAAPRDHGAGRGSRDRAAIGSTTTLDWDAQQLAVKWLGAAAIAPNLSARRSKAMLDKAEDPPRPTGPGSTTCAARTCTTPLWSPSTTGPATSSPMSGRAGYDRNEMASAEFEPKYDAAGDGTRQPGSAFKPVLYATAFDRKVLSPGQPAVGHHHGVRSAPGLGPARCRLSSSEAPSWSVARSSIR